MRSRKNLTPFAFFIAFAITSALLYRLKQSDATNPPMGPNELKTSLATPGAPHNEAPSTNPTDAKKDSPIQEQITQVTSDTAPRSKTVPQESISKAPTPNCFVVEYQHKPDAKKRDREDFLDFTNAFPIPHTAYNQKSLCVKVNQKPVPYQTLESNHHSEVRVGPIIGPDSVIQISYCTSKINCNEKCGNPAQGFMDDLMAETPSENKTAPSLIEKFKSAKLVMRDWVTLHTQEKFCSR